MADYDKLIDLDRLSAFKTKADAEYLGKDEAAARAAGILFGRCNSTSTSTAFTATVAGLSSLYDGACVMLHNGVVTSAANFTINVNNLGAKPCYSNMATGNDVTPTEPTRDTTIFNINYTMLFVYDSNIVSGGGWICYRGYDANTNTIGYQVRTNSGRKPASDKGYRYRIWLTSADGSMWVPINTSTSTDATTARTLNSRKIDPFGPIAYNSTNGTCNAAANLPAATMWRVYTLTIGYSYVKTLTAWDSVYLKCQPNTDGSAVMKDVVQALPSSKDGYIYIHLGTAYSTTAMELQSEHPVYWHDGTGIRIWTGAEPGSGVDPATVAPSMDGTAAVGSSVKYAREDHVHPSDTSKVDKSNTASGGNISITSKIGYGDGQAEVTSRRSSDGINSSVKVSPISASLYSTDSDDEHYGSTVVRKDYVMLESYDSSGSVTQSSSITVAPSGVTINKLVTPTADTMPATKKYVDDGLAAKQATLVSGTNIKTVNGESLLGSGDISTPNDIMAWYGTCSTAATANIKVVVCDGFVLKKGVLILVRFSAANTYSGSADIMLNVNSTGNKAIYLGQTPGNSTNLKWDAATDILFMYNGTNWLYISSMTAPSRSLLEGAGVYSGFSSTAANTAAKTSGGPQWSKKSDGIMIVRFTYGNTITSQKLTLNVNSTGAADIYVNGDVTSSSNTLLWNDHDALVFRWSGSYWDYICGSTAGQAIPIASTSTLGGVKVGSGLAIAADGTLSLDVASASGVSF